MKLKHSWMPGVFGLALFGLVAYGCDDSNSNPMPDDSVISAPKGGKSGAKTAGKGGGGSGGKAAQGSSGKSGQNSDAQAMSGGQGGSSNGGTGGSGGSAAGKGGNSSTGTMENATMSTGDCKGKQPCFCGAPKEQADFLNGCTEAMCAPYDNSKLKWNGEGQPPPLP